MKNIFKKTAILLAILGLFACDNGESVGPSQIDTDTPQLSELDIWLRDNFVTPYNIEIQYKWNENEVDLNRFLYPPQEENVKPLMEIVKAIWIDPFISQGGEDFIKRIAPRQFTLVGGYNFNPSGTITLGIAEGGTKITLFNVDQLDTSDLQATRRYFRTLQHEYGHILNQNNPYDPAFGEVNPENYTAQWFNRSIGEAREMGYITDYASSSESEDFVEMIATMLINSKDEYDAIVESISNEEAKAAIRIKEAMVVEYFAKEFDIDFYALQEEAYQRTLEIVN